MKLRWKLEDMTLGPKGIPVVFYGITTKRLLLGIMVRCKQEGLKDG